VSALPLPGERALYVLDLSGFVHRYLHGNPHGAAKMFIAMLQKLVDSRGPAYFAVAEDLQLPTFRHELMAEYKQGRSKRREQQGIQERVTELEQLRLAGEMAEDGLGVTRIAARGFEADDAIAAAVALARRAGIPAVVLCFDKDFSQLVTRETLLWDGKLPGKITDAAAVHAAHGVWPAQFADYLAMVGDTSDGVPGIWGCGPVAAAKVLAEFETLDDALDSAEQGRTSHPFWEANGKVWSRLAGSRAVAERSRKLVTLRADAPIGVTLDELWVEPDL
jgi:DNA polymerase-1